MQLGSSLERASQTARILNVHHHAIKQSKPNVVLENSLWLALLRASAGLQPFMRLHTGWVNGESVVRFLTLEPRFPRSIEHGLASAQTCLARIHARIESAATSRTRPEKAAMVRVQALRAHVTRSVAPAPDSEAMHEILSGTVDEVHVICEQVGRDFLGTGQG